MHLESFQFAKIWRRVNAAGVQQQFVSGSGGVALLHLPLLLSNAKRAARLRVQLTRAAYERCLWQHAGTGHGTSLHLPLSSNQL